MNCNQIETRLMDYLDGNLAARERQAIELHARACAACAERIQGFSGVFSMLDSWKDVQPSPSFNARLQKRIDAELSPSGWWGSLFARWIPLPAGNPVFALALLFFVSIAAVVVRYSPAPAPTLTSQQQPPYAAAAAGVDDLVLYRDLPVLENLDILGNFDVLQEIDVNR